MGELVTKMQGVVEQTGRVAGAAERSAKSAEKGIGLAAKAIAIESQTADASTRNAKVATRSFHTQFDPTIDFANGYPVIELHLDVDPPITGLSIANDGNGDASITSLEAGVYTGNSPSVEHFHWGPAADFQTPWLLRSGSSIGWAIHPVRSNLILRESDMRQIEQHKMQLWIAMRANFTNKFGDRFESVRSRHIKSIRRSTQPNGRKMIEGLFDQYISQPLNYQHAPGEK